MGASVNVVPNSPKISHLSKRDVFYLNLSWLNRNSRCKCCCADFSSDCHPWTRWLSKVVLKGDLRAFKETYFSESITSEMFEVWSWSFFKKCTKFYVDCKNSLKISKNIWGFWHNGVWTWFGISFNYDENISERQSTCYQIVLKFNI